MAFPHWKYFLNVEPDLVRINRYIEFHPDNYGNGTFSIKVSRLLMASTQEIDEPLWQICHLNGKGVDPNA